MGKPNVWLNPKIEGEVLIGSCLHEQLDCCNVRCLLQNLGKEGKGGRHGHGRYC